MNVPACPPVGSAMSAARLSLCCSNVRFSPSKSFWRTSSGVLVATRRDAHGLVRARAREVRREQQLIRPAVIVPADLDDLLFASVRTAASRIANRSASVPDASNRTISMPGKCLTISCASASSNSLRQSDCRSMLLDQLDDLRIEGLEVVSEDDRPAVHHVVDVFVPIDVVHLAAAGAAGRRWQRAYCSRGCAQDRPG